MIHFDFYVALCRPRHARRGPRSHSTLDNVRVPHGSTFEAHPLQLLSRACVALRLCLQHSTAHSSVSYGSRTALPSAVRPLPMQPWTFPAGCQVPTWETLYLSSTAASNAQSTCAVPAAMPPIRLEQNLPCAKNHDFESSGAYSLWLPMPLATSREDATERTRGSCRSPRTQTHVPVTPVAIRGRQGLTRGDGRRRPLSERGARREPDGPWTL